MEKAVEVKKEPPVTLPVKSEVVAEEEEEDFESEDFYTEEEIKEETYDGYEPAVAEPEERTAKSRT